MEHFRGSFIFTIIGLILAYFWAHYMNLGSELGALFSVFVLGVLEVSLSFDNAVINAAKLEKMSPLWQHRFLTWGMVIAVFGMRFLFPIFVVAIFSKIGILKVLNMAFSDPELYSHYLKVSHPAIITFGGAFLIMLFFSYFFNHEKDLHWIKPIEEKMAALGHFKSIGITITLLLILLTQHLAPEGHRLEILFSGVWGIVLFLLMEGLSHFIEHHNLKNNCNNSKEKHTGFSLKNSCFVNFLYLELIDASFSLDGVLGAFALSKDIFIITIGLSIGAMFVRSLTIMLVEKKTLKEYKFLEHGAHFAIGALALIMFISAIKEVSEVVTGTIGLVFILSALYSSIKENKNAQ